MDLKKELADYLTSTALVAFAAYVVRVVVRRQHITIAGFVLDAIASIFMGVVVDNAIHIYDIPNQVHIAIISLSGMIGPDLLAGMLILTSAFKEAPHQFIMKYVYAVQGIKTDEHGKPTTEEKGATTNVAKKDTP